VHLVGQIIRIMHVLYFYYTAVLLRGEILRMYRGCMKNVCVCVCVFMCVCVCVYVYEHYTFMMLVASEKTE
jgi:hypothetical protein